MKHFVTIKNFYGEGLSAPHPTPKLEDHPLLAVCDFLFSTFTTTPIPRGLPSIHSLRMRNAVVTRDPPNIKINLIRSYFLINLPVIFYAITQIKIRITQQEVPSPSCFPNECQAPLMFPGA
jgi:hypothetical protein